MSMTLPVRTESGGRRRDVASVDRFGPVHRRAATRALVVIEKFLAILSVGWRRPFFLSTFLICLPLTVTILVFAAIDGTHRVRREGAFG